MITRKGGQLKFLTNDQIYDIHVATLDLLERVGVQVESEDALKLLNDVGAAVDFKTKRARIGPDLVNEAVKKTPPSFILHARNKEHNLRIEDDRVYFMDGGLPTAVISPEGIRRPATLRDVGDLAKLYDCLEFLDLTFSAVFPTDIPEAIHHVHAYLAKLENTDKVAFYGYYARGRVVAQDLIRMASVVAGGTEELRRNPVMMGWENPVSPLSHSKGQTEMVLEFAKSGLPIHIGPAIQAGATGPVSLAGVLVQQNAEVLSGIVIAQSAAEPGKRPPIVYGAVPALADMRYGSMIYGAAEPAIMNVASVQIARYYGLVSRGNGGTTESKTIDAQAGFESAITLLMASLGGANLIMNATGGAMEPGIGAMSYEKSVIDNDIAGIVSRILQGITVSDDTLATDVISAVGPGGHFLAQEHTRRLFEKEQFIPKISDRTSPESWVKSGAKDIRMVARERVQQILKGHQPAPLDKTMKEELLKIIKDVEKREMAKA
jgi:trimethylamine--corrinoid protein Co-methyltransferase